MTTETSQLPTVLSQTKMDQNLVAVKIGFRGDLHRLRVDLNTFTLDALTQLFVRTFRLAPGSFIIKYTDAEGDTLNVCSDAEFVEACRVFLSGNHDELKALKFTAVEREGAASAAAGPSGNPADPLIQAVERLVVTLNATVDKVRQEEWKGVDVATEALSQAASEVQATLEATRTAVQEKPFDAVVGETSEGLKSAASGISSFAQRFVKSFIPDKKPEAAVVPPPAPVEPLVPVQPEEKVEEVPAVEEPAPALTPVEPEVVVATPPAAAPAVAFSEDEIKWAEQLSMVRGIFPDVETANAIRLLETHGGDVNIVINVLMEEMME